jgi:hypothetical protein
VFQLVDVVRRRAEIAVRDTPTGALLIDLASGRCWQLNRLAADFLSRLEKEQSLASVCSALGGRYEVAPEILERDVLRITEEMSNAGLIELVGR